MTTRNPDLPITILRRRAEILAAAATVHRGLDANVVVVLGVGSDRVGVDLSDLDEIAPLTPIAVLPGLPAWLAGVAQVRGQVVPVVDLCPWLGLTGHGRPRYLAVVRASACRMAILADSIADVREVCSNDVAETIVPAQSRGHRATTKDLVMLLNVPVLLAHPDLVVDHGGSEQSTSLAPRRVGVSQNVIGGTEIHE